MEKPPDPNIVVEEISEESDTKKRKNYEEDRRLRDEEYRRLKDKKAKRAEDKSLNE